MGIENNNAIIATTWSDKEVKRIKIWVSKLKHKKSLFLFSEPQINNKTTVVMIPDGSKENWADSNKGDDLRNKFIKELEKADYEDGSNPWDFVEVGFGEYGQKVLRGNCKNCYNNLKYAVN